jgi:hypothetical protein
MLASSCSNTSPQTLAPNLAFVLRLWLSADACRRLHGLRVLVPAPQNAASRSAPKRKLAALAPDVAAPAAVAAGEEAVPTDVEAVEVD